MLMVFFVRSCLEEFLKYWMKVARAMGAGVNTVILTVFFFGIITPISIILRVRGKDFLNIRNKSGRDSYWIKRESKTETYTQQF